MRPDNWSLIFLILFSFLNSGLDPFQANPELILSLSFFQEPLFYVGPRSSHVLSKVASSEEEKLFVEKMFRKFESNTVWLQNKKNDQIILFSSGQLTEEHWKEPLEGT